MRTVQKRPSTWRARSLGDEQKVTVRCEPWLFIGLFKVVTWGDARHCAALSMSDSLSKLEQQSSPASSYFIIARCCSELEPRGHDHDELRYDHSRELDGISSGVGYKCLLCEAGC